MIYLLHPSPGPLSRDILVPIKWMVVHFGHPAFMEDVICSVTYPDHWLNL